MSCYGKLRPYLNDVITTDEHGYCATESLAFPSTSGDARPLSVLLAQRIFEFLEYVDSARSRVQHATHSAQKLDRCSTARLAPLNEQKRIADKLDALLARVDACRERLDRVPLILKRFRQAVLAAATSGRLTEDWREAINQRNVAYQEMFERTASTGRFGSALPKSIMTPLCYSDSWYRMDIQVAATR